MLARHALSRRMLNTAQAKELIAKTPVLLFMKGTPDQPMCGFSRAAVQLLQMYKVPFASANVLDGDETRDAVKEASAWPTFPQLHVNNELLGGFDVLLDHHREDTLFDEFSSRGIAVERPPPVDDE